jgi:hypothetical protein
MGKVPIEPPTVTVLPEPVTPVPVDVADGVAAGGALDADADGALEVAAGGALEVGAAAGLDVDEPALVSPPEQAASDSPVRQVAVTSAAARYTIIGAVPLVRFG